MKNCKVCGQKNEQYRTYCRRCGFELANPPQWILEAMARIPPTNRIILKAQKDDFDEEIQP